MLTTRFATIEDIPLILKFIKDLAEFEKMSNDVKTDEAMLSKNLFEDRKSAEVLFAEKDGKPIGFALFFHNFSTFLGKPGLYLEDLYIQPEHRGSGAGMLLLKKMAEIAIERGCGRMEWWVLDWNKKAIDFYSKIGAKPMDEWTVYRLTEKEINQLSEK